MKRKTFALFVGPSLLMMLLFIAVPLANVIIQSFYVTRIVYHTATVEKCQPGFPTQICTKHKSLKPVLDENGEPVTTTEFVGLRIYKAILAPGAVAQAFSAVGHGWQDLMNIDFYKALQFTLTYTLVTWPLVIVLGLAMALAVNSIAPTSRGAVIFISILPMIITPVIGALSIRWLFVGDGIMTAALKALFGHPVNLLTHGWSLQLLLIFYGVWHNAPFFFVVFYAGLQTVNKDTLDAAVVDGASRWERLRYVVVPHLMPLIIFVSMLHLMDSYRVFDEVVGFSSQAYVISLQWLTYHFLVPDLTGNRQISSAAASSVLTMIGVIILLIPLVRHTWHEQRSKA